MAEPGAAPRGVRSQVGRRTDRIQRRLERETDRPLARFVLEWLRRYLEASRNSGSAATVYAFLSIAPTTLALIGIASSAGTDTNAFAERLITHLGMTGESADLVRDTFGTASSNALAASLVAILGFAWWGLGLGQIYQDLYSRAWNVSGRTFADQGRFGIWFAVLTGLVAGGIATADEIRSAGFLLLVPVWLAVSTAFWLWTPHYLLRGRIGLRALLPGALMTSVGVGGAIAVSPLFVGGILNANGSYFGSFGITVALLAWAFILITMSMACAVFSPLWWETRTAPPATHDEGRDR